MFSNASSDEEIRAFFQVMMSGDESEKNSAVAAACEKALAEMQGSGK